MERPGGSTLTDRRSVRFVPTRGARSHLRRLSLNRRAVAVSAGERPCASHLPGEYPPRPISDNRNRVITRYSNRAVIWSRSIEIGNSCYLGFLARSCCCFLVSYLEDRCSGIRERGPYLRTLASYSRNHIIATLQVGKRPYYLRYRLYAVLQLRSKRLEHRYSYASPVVFQRDPTGYLLRRLSRRFRYRLGTLH
jgi:hypothetical protein